MEMAVPHRVCTAMERAEAAGFTMSCDPRVGRLLSVLAAALPCDGRILELGTGTGVGLAWIVDGLGARADVEVVSVELARDIAALAAGNEWPAFVELKVGDALEFIGQPERYDLIFADAQGGKWEGLEQTIDSLRPGGLLLVDDMEPNRVHARRTPSKDCGGARAPTGERAHCPGGAQLGNRPDSLRSAL